MLSISVNKYWNIKTLRWDLNTGKNIKQLYDKFKLFINAVLGVTFFFFFNSWLTFLLFSFLSLLPPTREINYVTIHEDIIYRWSSEERTCPVQTSFFLYPLFCSLPFFLYSFLSPLLSRFRSVDILPMPIVKHLHRRHALLSLGNRNVRTQVCAWVFLPVEPSSLNTRRCFVRVAYIRSDSTIARRASRADRSHSWI